MTTLPFIYLAEITAYDPATSAEVVLRYSTGRGFVTAAADSPAHTPYEPVIEQAVEAQAEAEALGRQAAQALRDQGAASLLAHDPVTKTQLRLRGPAAAAPSTAAAGPPTPRSCRSLPAPSKAACA